MTRVMTEADYAAHQRKHGRGKGNGSTKPSGRATGPLIASKRAKKGSDYPRMLAKQIQDEGLPLPILEYAFDMQLGGSGRGWRFDLAWPPVLAVEVDGGVHKLTNRFNADIEKHQAAFKLGWKLLRVSPDDVKDGTALELVRKALS